VEPGLAGRIRELFKITPEDCFRVDFVSPLAILPGNQLRIAYVISDEGRPTRDMEILGRLEFIPTDTGWYVDPIRAHMLPEIGAVSVTPAGKPVAH
jgi:hypothetical protein